MGGDATEVFLGGLSPDSDEASVRASLPSSLLPQLSSIKVQQEAGGRCKGFAQLVFSSRSVAQRVCEDVREMGGRPVRLFITRGRTMEDVTMPSAGSMPFDRDPGEQ